MKKFSEFICKHTKLVVLISLILLVLSVIGSKLTKINYDILVYLPKEIETVRGQEILTNDFNMGAYSIAIIENMKSKDIISLEENIKDIDGVNEVVSLYDIIGTNIPIEMLPSEVKEKLHKNNTDLLFITFSSGTSAEKTIKAVDSIRDITKESVKLGGMSSMVLDTMKLSEKEIAIYIIIAVTLCIFILELSLDSYIAPIFLLLNIGFAILVNLGTNLIFGNISYITKALVAVLQLGVTTDFSIFLYHSYENKKNEYKTREEAMSNAIMETFTSVTGSSLTTIAGFLVLCTMSLTLGRDLGLVMAKGVLLGVISVLTLYPSLLLIFDKILTKTKHKVFISNFTLLNKFIIKHHIIIFIIFILLIIPMYLAYSKVGVYYKIDRSMPSYLDSKIANTKLKEEFNIASPEIILINKNLKNDEISSLVKELENVKGIEFVLSYAKLQDSGLTYDMLPAKLQNIFENDKYQLLIINSEYDIASDELNAQIEVVNDIVKKYDNNAIVAGEGPLMKDLIITSDTDFNNVNISSIICIFLILFIVLKSFSLPFLLISTIEFAIFTNMAISYFDGTVLPFVAPIVLGTIQLGATIDYAILMTSTYLEKRKNGMEKKPAMLETLNYSGHSIFISGMCFFAATFGVGLYSKLEMVGYLCTLISRGALISMTVVITILPSILLIFDKIILKTTINIGKVIKMNKKNVVKNISVWVMLLSIIFSSIPLNTYALEKNETVYSKLDSYGNVKSVLVTEELKDASNLEKIEDYTTLNDILNLSNNNTFYKDGNKLTWENGKKDLVYQGTTDKELPVSVNITYKLDNKDIALDDLLGKKGNVTITLKYTNKDKHSTKYGTLYTPFVVTVGTIVDINGNTNFKINNGKIVSTGTKNVIVGIATPGLYESLNLKELKGMDEITINYDTESFKLASIYSIISSKLLDNNDLKVFDKMNNLYEKVNTLQSGMNMIEDGSKKLNNGINLLNTNYVKFNQGLDLVNNNFYTLNNGVQELNREVTNVLNNKTVKEIRELLPELEKNAQKIKDITNKYSDNLNNIVDKQDNIVDTISTNLLNIITYLEEVEEYLTDMNNYQTIINNYTLTINNYLNSISNYLDTVNSYLDKINTLGVYAKNSTDYIINEYESDPENASPELKKLYDDAIKLQKIIDLDNVSNDIIKEKQSISNLQANLEKAKNKVNDLSKELLDENSELNKKITDAKNAYLNLQNLEDKVKEVSKEMHTNIDENRTKLNNGIKSINELPGKIKNIEKGIDNFENGINKISDGTSKLQEGINVLATYSNTIADGIKELESGSNELATGISKFNKEGISKISSLVNSNVKTTLNKTKELVKLGNNYSSFAGKSIIKGETKFILVVDSKTPKKDETKSEINNEKISFWQRILNLFK